jgi:flagellar protein FlaI
MPKSASLLHSVSGLFGWFWKPAPPEEALFTLTSSSNPLPPDAKLLGSPYKLDNGVGVQIGVTPKGKGLFYVQEPPLDEAELRIFRKIMSHLAYEMPFEVSVHGVRMAPQELTAQIQSATSRVVDTYRASLKAMYRLATPKILYYVTRDVIGYGPIDPLFHEPNLEDMKSEGYNIPFIVINRQHSELRWMETNITLSPSDQDALGLRLAHMGGRTLSTAFPVAEVMLPGRHRLMVVYGREVSPKGTAIEVRLFRADPFTISYLIRTNMLSPLMAAYLWMILESRGSILIVGETGSGKTSLTCALGVLIHPAMSVLTIEDIPELRFPHDHWLPLTTRSSYTVEKGETGGRRGGGRRAGEIDQFDLLRVALRVRPDFITVGEVIGEETQTLFQAIATGQGTITTFHSFDVNSAFQRLTSRPIDTPTGLVSGLDCIVTIRRLKMSSGLFERRVTDIHEPLGTERADIGKFRGVFGWDPSGDWFAPASATEVLRRSRVLIKYGERQGISLEGLTADLEEKAALVTSLAERGVEKFEDVVNEVWKYYATKLPPLQVEPAAPMMPTSAFDDMVRKLGER